MLYNFLWKILISILYLFSLANRKLKIFLKKRLKQNFDLEDTKYTWFHCSSVGEVNLSEILIKEFLDKTDHKILLSVVTDTGYETAIKKYRENKRISLIFFPLDKYSSIKIILKKIKLQNLILVETEIWPNLINLCSENSKVFIINGRISDKSYRTYLKLKKFLKGTLNNISGFIMQTEEDKKRIISLGAKIDKTYNFGNLKFDIKLPLYPEEELEKLKNSIKIKNKKIFVAGSTRDGEEEHILKVFDKMRGYFLFLVPRHIERCDDIEKRLLENKYNYLKWTDIEKQNFEIKEEPEIMLVNKIGILRKLYALCDISFVGGTLVNIGGHSLLEPLYYNKFPIFGKYVQNIKEISKEVLERNIGFEIEDTNSFLNAIQKIESGEVKKDEIKRFFLENSKVAKKTFELIVKKTFR